MTYFDQIEWIKFIQSYRTSFLDNFFKILNLFDTTEFYFIIVLLVWLIYRWQMGLKLFYILFIGKILNYALKNYFALPRPFRLDSSLTVIEVPDYGFPSGAAHSVILLGGVLLAYWKNPRKWLYMLTYMFFISLSRLYLGVHFITDIIGGWTVGFFLLFLFFYVLPWIENYTKDISPLQLFLISHAFTLTILTFTYSLATLTTCALALGVSLGTLISYYKGLFLPPYPYNRQFFYCSIIGVVGMLSCYSLAHLMHISSKSLEVFIQFYMAGLWLSCGASWICLKLFGFKPLKPYDEVDLFKS